MTPKPKRGGGGILSRYEPVIGLEVHCQLKTFSKLFCGCSTAFGAPVNHQVCPVCLGLPGSLPVLNRKAVDFAIAMALAVGGRLAECSFFARKHYFYPDLPKGYQITQFDRPYCEGGGLTLANGTLVRLRRIHLEEDAGKNIHGGEASYVDLNRAGVPLMEIVSEPDIRSPQEAAEFLRRLRSITRYLGVSDGNLEEGSFRCDANVSLRPRGQATLGTRCEIKNLNSFRNIEKAITYEILRQADQLDGGEGVDQQTLLWDPAAGRTRLLRKKGDGEDYRYFSDPDLPPLVIKPERMAAIAASLPELPAAKAARYREALGLAPDQASLLTADKDLADYFEAVLAAAKEQLSSKTVANWLCSEFLREANDGGWDLASPPVDAAAIAELLLLVAGGSLSGKMAKDVWQRMLAQEGGAQTIAAAHGLAQVTDRERIGATIARVLADHPEQVREYIAGKEKIYGFFVGQIMKQAKGQFSPELTNLLLQEQLDGARSSG